MAYTFNGNDSHTLGVEVELQGHDLVLDEATGGVDDHLLFFGQIEIHGIRLPAGEASASR